MSGEGTCGSMGVYDRMRMTSAKNALVGDEGRHEVGGVLLNGPFSVLFARRLYIGMKPGTLAF